jgi:hypothetical protein
MNSLGDQTFGQAYRRQGPRRAIDGPDGAELIRYGPRSRENAQVAGTVAMGSRLDYENSLDPGRSEGQLSQSRRPSLLNPWGLIWLATGLGLCADGLAVYLAPDNFSLGLSLFWPAVAVPFMVYAAVLLTNKISQALRQTAIALIGIYPAATYRLSSPFVLGGFDEHLHERTLADLLRGGGLFAPNPMLPVSPDYPGMELFTGIFVRLSGAPVVLGESVVVLLCRLFLMLIIYQSALTVTPSRRVASLAVILYATSPQFYFFNSQFAYQSMALPLGLGGLLLLRRAQFTDGITARRLAFLAYMTFAATTVTHHITSWFVWAFLLAWTLATPRAQRKLVLKAAAFMGVSITIWTVGIAGKMANYLGPVFISAVQQFEALAHGQSQRQSLGSSPAGIALLPWQRILLITYAVFYTSMALVCGVILLRRAFRYRNGRFGLLGILCVSYPITLAAHFVPSAANLGDRASTFLFLPLALSTALVLARDPSVRPRAQVTLDGFSGRMKPSWFLMFTAALGLLYIGGISLGSGPDWQLLPGSYMVSAEARTQDPETIAAVRWAATHLPPGSRIVADRTPAALLAAETSLWIVTTPPPKLDLASVYFSDIWTTYQTMVLQQLHIRYLYVDQRLSESLPQEGYYIYPGETLKPERISAEALSKFSEVPGLKAVYHHGPVTIYDTSGLGVTSQLDGFTSDRSMGLGKIGDFLLGVLIIALVYAFRRRLRWIKHAVHNAGPLGAGIALMSAVIFVGFILFGLRIIPGPSFSIGACLTLAVLVTVHRLRSGVSIVPSIPILYRVDPLIILGILAGVIGLTASIHSAWNFDVTEVDNILRAVAGHSSH